MLFGLAACTPAVEQQATEPQVWFELGEFLFLESWT